MSAISSTIREQLLRRLLSPNPPSLSQLARETGISKSSLCLWRQQAVASPLPSKATMSQSTRTRSPQDKLSLLYKAAALSDEALGGFLRQEGVHAVQLQQWKEEALAGLSIGAVSQSALKGKERDIRRLESELERKDKALAEAAALLMLQKKARAWREAVGGSTAQKSGR